jgi:hypothetical protein
MKRKLKKQSNRTIYFTITLLALGIFIATEVRTGLGVIMLLLVDILYFVHVVAESLHKGDAE